MEFQNHENYPRKFIENNPVLLHDADPNQVIKKQGRYLPHWTLENGIYFVRFRLADSLAESVRDELYKEKAILSEKIKNPHYEVSPGDKRLLVAVYSEKVERLLDNGYGECWMKHDPIAELVANALKFFNNDRYRLYAWCVMPNHVHVIVQVFAKYKLYEILKSWKSYTSHQANKILGRTGQFWLPENYDRLIRNELDLESKTQYVIENPERAGLGNWKWSGKELK